MANSRIGRVVPGIACAAPTVVDSWNFPDTGPTDIAQTTDGLWVGSGGSLTKVTPNGTGIPGFANTDVGTSTPTSLVMSGTTVWYVDRTNAASVVSPARR